MQHSQLVNTESRDLESWVERLWVSDNPADRILLEKTVRVLLDPVQNDNESLYPNSLDVAETLRNIDVDQATLLATLLSDPSFLETTEIEDIAAEYGEAVAALCENMRTLHHFRESTQANAAQLTEKQQAEQIRRMLLALIKDIRAVLN